ncbi:MAG: carbonic anhydrase [Proteobacteria bacterium]|nr:carbonic anhydrase [Pseudomonadota bacterium]
MKKLIQGIVEFRETVRPAYQETFARLALGQSPDTLLISCSDSRVVPNLFASTDPGDVFVIRNVGNLIPPCGDDGINIFDKSEAAAIEYAVEQLKVKDIIICGHSECAAHQALIQGSQSFSPNLRSWLRHGEPALNKMREAGYYNPEMSPHNQLSQINVLQQLEHLQSYPCVWRALEAGRLQLHGWWFDIAKADLYAWEPQYGRYIIIDREEAAAILARLGH